MDPTDTGTAPPDAGDFQSVDEQIAQIAELGSAETAPATEAGPPPDAPAPDVAQAPDVATEQPTAPAAIPLDALGPVVAQAIAQALGPLLERFPAPAAPQAAPAPKPWELPAVDALRSALPEHASDYTREQYTAAARELATWERAANDPNHERYQDAQRAVAHHRAEMRRAHHTAQLEQRLAEQQAEMARLQAQPAQAATRQQYAELLAKPEILEQARYPKLAAFVRAGGSVADALGHIDWANPEAVAGVDGYLRAMELVASAQPTQANPALAPAAPGTPAQNEPKLHNPANSIPPRSRDATASAADDGRWYTSDELLAEAAKL